MAEGVTARGALLGVTAAVVDGLTLEEGVPLADAETLALWEGVTVAVVDGVVDGVVEGVVVPVLDTEGVWLGELVAV